MSEYFGNNDINLRSKITPDKMLFVFFLFFFYYYYSIKKWMFSYFCTKKPMLWVLIRSASSRRF